MHRILLEGVIATLVSASLVGLFVSQGGWFVQLSPAVWIYIPILVLAVKKLPRTEHGFSLSSWRSGWRWLFLSVALVLVPYAVVVQFYRGFAAEPWGSVLERVGAAAALYHLALIAIPEELFFRGYLQSRLIAWSKANGIHGPALPILLTALLFALAHIIVTPGWERAAVFFPGMVMSWLRYRSGSLLASAGFHWLANLLQTTL
jgi:membrane protease YdiL (CAAX protease family)